MSKEITTMTIRAFDGTCVVLNARESFKPVKDPLHGQPSVILKVGRVGLTYDDGSRFEFYIDEGTLVEFIKQSVNLFNFSSTDGQIARL